MQKYHNIKTTVDGILFDSKKEAEKYRELKIMQKCGAVLKLELQPKFELVPPFTKDGQKYRAIHYVADFDVQYSDGTREIIDVKGFQTAVFKLKARMFDYTYPDLTLVLE